MLLIIKHFLNQQFDLQLLIPILIILFVVALIIPTIQKLKNKKVNENMICYCALFIGLNLILFVFSDMGLTNKTTILLNLFFIAISIFIKWVDWLID